MVAPLELRVFSSVAIYRHGIPLGFVRPSPAPVGEHGFHPFGFIVATWLFNASAINVFFLSSRVQVEPAKACRSPVESLVVREWLVARTVFKKIFLARVVLTKTQFGFDRAHKIV